MFVAWMLLSFVPIANAGVATYNVDSGPGHPRTEMDVLQDVYLVADNLEFSNRVLEPLNYEITGWRVEIPQFFNVLCGFSSGSKLQTDVRAFGDDIIRGSWVHISVDLWVNPYSNKMDIINLRWSDGIDISRALPDHGWLVPAPGEMLYVYNRDAALDFTISDFKWHISTTDYPDLTLVPFDHFAPGSFFMGHGMAKQFSTPFGGLTDNAFLYFHYKMYNSTTSTVVMELWGSHNIQTHEFVGGTFIPIDKFGLLAPYIGLASTAMIGAVATVVYVRRAKRKEDKQ